jgi:hypothetical protein
MVANVSERITIQDFRPGIFSDYHAALAATPAETTEGAGLMVPGVATVENTYRCVADRAGSLTPLPALASGKTSGQLPNDEASSKYLTGMHASYLLDATILTEMFVEGTQVPDDSDRAAVFTMYGQWYETDLFRWTVIATMHRMFHGSTEKQDIMWAKVNASLLASEQAKAQIGGGNFTTFRTQELAASNFTRQSMAWVAYGAPGYSATSPAWVTGTMSAGEQALTDFDDANSTAYPATASARILGLFPDFDDINSSKSKFLSISGFTAVTLLATHAGRLIGLSRDHGEFGQTTAAAQLGNLTEHVHYTPPFDFDASLGIGDLEFGTFGETKPYLSGIVASITSDDLLLIRDHGGGIMVRGDLNDPTIIQLPFVHSTRGVKSLPVSTPFGLFYGTRNGVYVWTGGETSEHVSPQIDGFFWNNDTEAREHLGSRGRFAWWEPWVCVPNNYLFDTRHQSWWRLDEILNSAGFNCYDVAPSSNNLYAFPWRLDETNNVQWYTATPETLAQTYSWQSQPLAGLGDRVISAKDVRILATNPTANASTVTVTLSGFKADGTAVTPVSTVLNLAANVRPQQVDAVLEPNFIARYVQVRIEASGVGQVAPKVHALSIGIAARQRVVNT